MTQIRDTVCRFFWRKHILEKPCSSKSLRMVWAILFALFYQEERERWCREDSTKIHLAPPQPELIHWGLHCSAWPSASMEEDSEPRTFFGLGFLGPLGISNTSLDSLPLSLPSARSQNQQVEFKKSLIIQYFQQPSSKRNMKAEFLASLSWISMPQLHTWQSM